MGTRGQRQLDKLDELNKTSGAWGKCNLKLSTSTANSVVDL